MSSLQVANLLFESTGNNRIEYSGSNTFNMYAGNNVVFTANGTGIEFPNLTELSTQTISVGNSTVNTTANSTSISVGNSIVNTTAISVGSEVTVNTTAISVGNSTANVLMSGSQLSINGQNVSPVQSFRNKIINGNFDYWQRGTSNTSVSSGQFLADRWRYDVAGSATNSSRQTFGLGQTDVPNEPTYFHRSVVTSSAAAGNYSVISHRCESVRTLAGQTATLSFWAKADASKNIAIEFVQAFGTGGSPSTAVNAIGVTTCALTTSWQKFTITVNIPSISGKTLGTNDNNYLELIFWFDGGSNYNSRTNSLGQQSGTFDIAQVQLEAGSVATPFEMRPPGIELALCQRYFEKSTNQGTSITTNNSATLFIVRANSIANGEWYAYIQFAVTKRATPTMTTYPYTTATNTGRWSNNAGTDYGAASATTGSTTDSAFRIYNGSGGTITTTFFIMFGGWYADSEL